MNPILKRTLTALSVATLVICAIIYAPVEAILPVLCVFGALAVLEFGQLLAKKVAFPTPRFFLWFVPLAIILAELVIAPLSFVAAQGGNLMLLYVIAVIKISDMGGFAFGLTSAKLMKGGNHKLCPTISPNKSWEGLLGSVFGSCLVSTCFMSLTHFGLGKSLLIGIVAALVGTFGDLVESKFKRWIGVKDSSTMTFTNGMGGILDMLDSLLFAPTAIALLIWCL